MSGPSPNSTRRSVIMDREQFVTCIQVLNALLHADEDFSDNERAYLSQTMDEMSFTAEEREAAGKPMTEAERNSAIEGLPGPVVGGLLQSLMRGALVDGIDAREREFISRLARAIRIDDYTITYLWERVEEEVEEEHQEAKERAAEED